jgi:hypothetical protein
MWCNKHSFGRCLYIAKTSGIDAESSESLLYHRIMHDFAENSEFTGGSSSFGCSDRIANAKTETNSFS